MAVQYFRAFSALSLSLALAACGGSIADDNVVDQTTGGSGQTSAGTGGTGQAGKGQAGSGAAGVAGKGGGQGGAGQAGKGGSAGVGAGGGGTTCPPVAPPPGSACDTAVSCGYETDGPCPAFTQCICNGKSWDCFSEGPPCDPCGGPVNEGDPCKVDGLACGDQCNNSCVCSQGKWFCEGTCGGDECSPGQQCKPGSACTVQGEPCDIKCKCSPNGTYNCKKDCPPDVCQPGGACMPGNSCQDIDPGTGCTNFCFCDDSGNYQCKQDCTSQCAPGAKCAPGTGCGTPLPGGCFQNCSCNSAGVYQCKTDCPDNCGPEFFCSPGTSCATQLPNGCTQDCFCTNNGLYECKQNCSNQCAPGAFCSPGSGCGTQLPNGCSQSCFCNQFGTYECKTDCPGACTDELVPCGQECKFPGADCVCSQGGMPVPCTCTDLGINSLPFWQCGGPSGCTQGAKCNPGEGCASGGGPGQCSTSCSCNFNGTYDCKTDCPPPPVCPPKPQACGSQCAGSEGAQCSCLGNGQIQPCSCQFANITSVWACNGTGACQQGAPCNGEPCKEQTPDGCTNVCSCNFNGTYDCKQDCPGSCSPGAFCSPGSACSVPQGDPGCFLSCTCSQGGLYQCSAACSGTCPDTMPIPGSACMPEAQSCKYPGGFCDCKGGAWICALFKPCTSRAGSRPPASLPP